MNKLQKLLNSRKETYVEKTPNDIYRNISESTPLTSEELSSIGGLESQHGKFDRPLQGGSAQGLFQFQPKTAEYLSPGSSESLSSPETQTDLMKLYLNKNKVESVEDAFAKHNLGPSRGRKFMEADDSASIGSVIPDRIIRANPGLYNVKTIGEARQRIKQKLADGSKSSDIQPSFLDLFKEKK